MTTTNIHINIERPAHRRAQMWDHVPAIREMIDSGYGYKQIVRELRLPVSASRLGKWCRRNGIFPPFRPPILRRPERPITRAEQRRIDEHNRRAVDVMQQVITAGIKLLPGEELLLITPALRRARGQRK